MPSLQALAEMDFTEHGAEADDFAKIPYFHFSPTAQEFFNEWFLQLKTRQRNDDEPVMSEHLSKYPKLMPGLALIFHLVELADKTVTAQGPCFTGAAEDIPLGGSGSASLRQACCGMVRLP